MIAVELLSPARDLLCGTAAIDHGADAVYVGAPRFGARAAAGNSWDDIAALVRYAHRYRAKVHVALNTILSDKELEEAAGMAHRCYDLGVDALIVQDMGLLRADLPPIALHASTQTDLRTPEKVRFMADAGFCRVVLSRELSLNQIAEIHRTCPVELEAFVHGSLCVSYSGQCYMSQFSCGRSANRGACAQYCRLPYDLTDSDGRLLEQGRHLLSLKDLDRSDYLGEMIDAGVTSFKIEGRLKGADYVKNVTLYYRNKIDALLERRAGGYGKASCGRVYAVFSPNPEKSFHRGATDYFLHGKRGDMACMESPKSFGEPVGRVVGIRSRSFRTDGRAELHNGDGLCFTDASGRMQGFRANAVRDGWVYPMAMPAGLRQGTQLFRNEDHVFGKMLEKVTAQRRLPVGIVFSGTEEGFSLRLADEECNCVEVFRRWDMAEAEKPEKVMDRLRQQLSRLGQTEFEAAEVRLELERPWFVPDSLVAEMRREAVEMLRRRREEWRPADVVRSEKPGEYPLLLSGGGLDYRANVMNSKARQFYSDHGATEVEWAMERQDASCAGGKVLMQCRYCLRDALGMCLKRNPEKAVLYREPLYLRHGNLRYRLRFDCNACEMYVISE